MCPINSRSIVFPPECPWITRKYAQEFLESSQYSNLVSLLPWWTSRNQCFSEKSRAPCFAIAFSSTSYRVQMMRCVRFSFILIVMTHHSCNHFGDRCWQSSSIRWSGRSNFPLLLGRGNVSLCEKRRLAGKNAESVRSCFLDACLTCNMGRTSLLDACLRLCQARFSSFSFLKFSLSSALGKWTSCTNRLFSLDIIT